MMYLFTNIFNAFYLITQASDGWYWKWLSKWKRKCELEPNNLSTSKKIQSSENIFQIHSINDKKQQEKSMDPLNDLEVKICT